MFVDKYTHLAYVHGLFRSNKTELGGPFYRMVMSGEGVVGVVDVSCKYC